MSYVEIAAQLTLKLLENNSLGLEYVHNNSNDNQEKINTTNMFIAETVANVYNTILNNISKK